MAISVHGVLLCHTHNVLLVDYVGVLAAALFILCYPNTCSEPGNLQEAGCSNHGCGNVRNLSSLGLELPLLSLFLSCLSETFVPRVGRGLSFVKPCVHPAPIVLSNQQKGM